MTASGSHQASSPASTGGAGTTFEQHVDAWLLGQLLVGAIPPVLTDCRVVEVQMQTEHLGWHTDDFVVVGENGAGGTRNLAGQVKRTFTVSSSDGDCRKTIEDAWQDFRNARVFSADNDGLAIVTLRGTNVLLGHFSSLLDCARASRDADDFEHRLTTQGVVHGTVTRYCNELRRIVDAFEGRTVAWPELWGFLRVLYVVSLDLNTDTCQSESSLKTLLAHTTNEQDALGTAEASWNALVREATRGMPQARRYRRQDLPESLRNRHGAIAGSEERVLTALREHAAPIVSGIRTLIGQDVHLGRPAVVQRVLASIESAQIVLVSGPAGSGKSVVAKEAIDAFADDHFVFTLRGEEFARAHFDETLHQAQVPANSAALAAILAGQARKVLLIESLERLLEHSTRSAFADLLTLIKQDASWRVVVTCRDYSADLVRSSLFDGAGLQHVAVTVPLLEDRDIEEVSRSIARLSRPLSNRALRRLLRNPYILDKAAQMEWPEDRPLPENEREFRARFWNEVIRANHHPQDAMPRRREAAFTEIAVRRARALSLHVPIHDLDVPAVARLHQDSLVTYADSSDALAAPAHDVLEDWAILRWVDEQYQTLDGSLTVFAERLGTYPAIRRTYRKWLSELLVREVEAADEFFETAISDESLPAYFRDDIIVSFLRSDGASTFLERHSDRLFAHGKGLLKRIIHLLRVGCVTTPAWLDGAAAHLALYHVPDGPAWRCVLHIVADRLASFSATESLLLLGFIEDWARGVSWDTPYPGGFEDAAAIAFSLLRVWGDYSHEEQRKKALHLLAKIPNGNREGFCRLLVGGNEDRERNRATVELREILFEGMEATPACRDIPNEVIETLRQYLMLSEEDVRDPWRFGGSLMLEPRFGIKQARHFDFVPPSALRGPFLPLLRHHLELGLQFFIELFNHSADWYANPRIDAERLEPAWQLSLSFADGSSQTQWANGRLWQLYRGTSVGPCVLQTALMALEQHLLDIGRSNPVELDDVLLRILRESESCALTAVVAGVATAFPHSSAQSLLVLLRSRDCVQLDRTRLVGESHDPARLSLPMLGAYEEIYAIERQNSSSLPHRKRDIEMAVLNLQVGPCTRQVQEVLDEHRNALPPVEEQEEHDRIWRLALHRMDLRQYNIADQQNTADTEVTDDVRDGSVQDDATRVVLALDVPDADLREMLEQDAPHFADFNARLALQMWAMRVFERDPEYAPEEWRDRLRQARQLREGGGGEGRWEPGRGGPGIAAAVCVRDFWEDLSDDEKEWCLDVVCSEIEQDANEWVELQRVQLGSMQGDRSCAWVVPSLVGKTLNNTWGQRVSEALVLALTHAIDEVRNYAVSGIGNYLWSIDRDLALRCVNAIAWEADRVTREFEAERDCTYRESKSLDQIEAEVARAVRERFFMAEGIPADAYRDLDCSGWFGAKGNSRILRILFAAPEEDVSIQAFSNLCAILVQWWDADEDNRGRQQRDRPHNVEPSLAEMLEGFVHKVEPAVAASILAPIVGAAERHAREVSSIIRGLIGVEDRLHCPERFWAIWQLFADAVRDARWLEGIDSRYSTGRELVRAVFLGGDWRDNVRHWRTLEGYADRVHALFEELPPSATVLGDYVEFLYHIGERSLPDAFVRLAGRLTANDWRAMLARSNTVFMMEVLLRRFVYGRPAELKRTTRVREATLTLLDLLIEMGSSAAYRMRDDFVTPMATE
jgi:hypothetical protein